MSTTDSTSAGTIARLAVAATGVVSTIDMPDGRQFITHPPQYVVKDVTRTENVEPPLPKYIRQTVAVQTKKSLIDYIERFKTAETVVFANMEMNEIVAVIDYHSDSASGPSKPAITSHRAVLDLEFSNQWGTWTGIDGQWKRQAEFAQFIEENSADILTPTGAALLEMVLDLEKAKTIRVVRKMRSAGSDAGEGGNTMEVNGTELPNKFSLSMPVYFGEGPVGVTAYTRDQLKEQTILIGFSLSRTEIIRQTEFLRISAEIADATGVPMIAGAINAV